MKIAIAKKVSTQECYNNEYQVISLHDEFELALSKSGESEIVIDVESNVSVADSIDDSGKLWVSQ